MEKKLARNFISKKFSYLLTEERNSLDQKILINFIEAFPDIKNLNIGSYLSIDSEVKSTLINEYLLSQSTNLFLPKIVDYKNKKLNFFLYSSAEDMLKNKYGICEPSNKNKPIPIQKLDLIIIPLRAINKNFSRLGFGGGYYDSSLKGTKKNKCIGLCYEFQRLNKINTEKHDLELGGLITPNGYFKKS
jgi:5-formyltetrahydrofolate cyclo-ligase